MADQPAGADQPYLAQNPEGVGAVFFDKPSKDLLAIHLDNLAGVDKALGEKKEKEKQARVVAQKLLEYKNPDTNGIFTRDSEAINKKGQEVTSAMTDLLRTGKQDPSNPEWVSAYNSLNNKKQELLTLIGASKAYNQKINQIGAKMATGELKNADAAFWAKNYTDALGMSADERYSHPIYSDPVQWIRDKPIPLDEMLSTHFAKNWKDYQEPTRSNVEITKGVYGQQIHKTNLTPDQLDVMANSYLTGGYDNSKEAVDEAYTNQPQEVTDKYFNQAKASGISNDLQAEQEAKKLWLKDHIHSGFVKEQNSFKFDGITPQERQRLKLSEGEAKEIAKGGWLWTQAKGSIDPNSDVSSVTPYKTVNGITINLKGNTALNGIPEPKTVTVPVFQVDEVTGKVKTDANGKPKQALDINKNPVTRNIQNHILANGYDANGDYVLVTSASKYMADATGDTKQELMVMNPTEAFDYIKTNVAGSKYAAGASALANAEGHRDKVTGKVTFKENPKLKEQVQAPIVEKKVAASPKKEDKKVDLRKKYNY